MSGATCSDIATASIPLEHYEKKRAEWDIERDKLQAGLMMYRWKFEEQEKLLRLLPAPVEAVGTILEQKDRALQDAQAAITMMELELKAAREIIEVERSRPWWQRVFSRGR